MKKIILLILLCSIFFKARSQEYLDLSEKNIKNNIASKGGLLVTDRIVQDGFNPGPFKLLTYTFSKATIEHNGIYMISFFSKQNKCYKYVTSFASDKFLKSITDKFDDPKNELKSDKKFIWYNSNKAYEIEVLKPTQNNPTGSFMTDIHKKLQ